MPFGKDQKMSFRGIDLTGQSVTVEFLSGPPVRTWFVPMDRHDGVGVTCPFDGTYGSCSLCDEFLRLKLIDFMSGKNLS